MKTYDAKDVSANIQHSSANDSWMTPFDILARVHHVLGDIHLDPASSAQANARVGAANYFTAEDDGLLQPWSGTIFCNPPGGKRGNSSLPCLFWAKLMAEVARGEVTDAIFLCFSIEALQNTQGKAIKSVGDFTFCVPSRRIKFDHPTLVKTQPSHANAVVYVPGTHDASEAFAAAFRTLGVICAGRA